MNYVEFSTGKNEYKLRLSTRAIVALEKQIGCNPLMIFGVGDTVPTVTTMVYILHAALQQLQHNITVSDAYDIFDEWLADGHAMTDFIPVILDIYKHSGLINKEDTEKN